MSEEPAVFWRKKYRVKLTGRAGLVYSERPRRMRVDSELQSGPDVDIIVYAASINRWEPPHQDEPLSTEDILRIRNNIAEALSNLRMYWR